MKNKKVIILGTLGIATIVTATVVPIVLLNKDEETTKKDIVLFANKLKALKAKSIKIAKSGTITSQKQDILDALKQLKDFPKAPNGVSLEIKDDSTQITSAKEVGLVLIVKKDGETNIEVKDFKVKSFSDKELVDHFANKIKTLKTKEIQIEAVSGTITEKKNDIIEKIKALDDFPELHSGVTIEVKNDSTALTIDGVPIELEIKKGTQKALIKVSEGFKAIRSASDQEKIDILKQLLLTFLKVKQLSNEKFKVIKIDSSPGSVTDKKAQILEKIKEKGDLLNQDLLNQHGGIEIDIAPNSSQIKPKIVTPIIVQIKKGSAIANIGDPGDSFQFEVIRSYTSQENITAIEEYFQILKNKKIFIPSSTSISSAADILIAVKSAIGENLTNKQKALITLKSGQPTSLVKGKATSVSFEVSGGSDITLSITHKKSAIQKITDYFQILENKKIFIPNSTLLSTGVELLKAVKDAIGSDLEKEEKDLITSKSGQPTLLTKGKATSVTFEVSGGGDVTLSITQRTSDAQSIFDYFEQEGKKEIFIPNSTLIDDKTKLTTAIQNALATADSTTFTSVKKTYVIVADDYNDFNFVEGTAKNVKVKIQKDSETPEFITLVITKRTSDAQRVVDYFEIKENQNIFISNSNLHPTGQELLIMVKNYISDALTNNQKNLITLTRAYESYAPFLANISIEVEFLIGKEVIKLLIIVRNNDAQSIFDYFEQENKKEIFIPNSTSIDDKAKLTTAIQNALATADSTTFTNVKKTYVTVVDDYNDFNFVEGTVKNVKVKIQKGTEIAEFITLVITKRTSDAQRVVDYFEIKENQNIFISNSNLHPTGQELLIMVKNYISDALTNNQKNLITLTRAYESSAPFPANISIVVEFLIGKEVIKLSIIVRNNDAQSIFDYFEQENKKEISIPNGTIIDDKAKLTTAIQNALATADSTTFTSVKKTYVTVVDDYNDFNFVEGTAKNVKVKIQKGTEIAEFITLSVTLLANS